MRTSKLAQDTTRIMSALSNRRSSTRIATAKSTQESPETSPARHIEVEIEHMPVHIKAEDFDSHLSQHDYPPDDPNASSAITPTSRTPGKRKRALHDSPIQEDSKRRSPRKVIVGAIKDENAESDGFFPRPTRRLPSKHIKNEDGSSTVLPPPNWERMYSMTAAMRARRVAAVDTMGCESLADDTRSPLDRRLQTLVALMLSSQTKDPVTAAAIKNMQDNLPRGFTLQDLLEVSPERLNELIAKVGFHNNKTRFIKRTAEILRDEHAGDIPDSIEGLMALPGVGPKMAYLTLSAAWGRTEGIGVDVHVHRITNLWGWHKTRNPEETRLELESWLPRDRWHAINHLLVGFGQTYCPPVGRRCEGCDLAREGLCPSAVVPKELKRKLVKKEGPTEEVKQEVLVKASDEAPPLDLGPGGEVQGDGGIKTEVVVET